MITKITQAEINDAYKNLSRRYEGRKEDYFGLLYLSKKFNLTLDDAAQFVAFGGNDYGIDGFFLTKKEKSVFVPVQVVLKPPVI